eukprot:COSAG02_NODE_1722_length_11193_cov_39.876600_9_plen_443_part_00
MNLLKPSNMVLSRLFALARTVALFKIANRGKGSRPPFTPVTAKTADMIGLPAVSLWFKGSPDEAWYFGEVMEQKPSRVTVRFHDDDTVTAWKHSEIIANSQNNEGYVLPHDCWEDLLKEMESRKKHWKVTIETDKMAAIFEKRSKAMKAAKGARRAPAGGGAAGAASKRTGGKRASVAGAAAGAKQPRWNAEELADLREMVAYRGNTDWALIARELGTGRSPRAVMGKWSEFKQVQEQVGAAGEDEHDAAMKLVVAASAGLSGVDEGDDTAVDLVADAGQLLEHARENALMLREAGWRPKDGVWHEAVTAEGYRYYVNQTTGESSWDAPAVDSDDVVGIKERLAWRDAAYQDRFREQDRAEAEAQELEELEAANMGLAPVDESGTDEEQEEQAQPRAMKTDAAAAANGDEVSNALLVAQLSTTRRKQPSPSVWPPAGPEKGR